MTGGGPDPVDRLAGALKQVWMEGRIFEPGGKILWRTYAEEVHALLGDGQAGDAAPPMAGGHFPAVARKPPGRGRPRRG